MWSLRSPGEEPNLRQLTGGAGDDRRRAKSLGECPRLEADWDSTEASLFLKLHSRRLSVVVLFKRENNSKKLRRDSQKEKIKNVYILLT